MISNVLRIGGWEFFGLLILASAVVHLLFIFFYFDQAVYIRPFFITLLFLLLFY